MESKLESSEFEEFSVLVGDLKMLREMMDTHNKMRKDIEDLKEEVMERIKKEYPQGIELPREFGTYRNVQVTVSQRSAYTCEATEFEVLKWSKKRKPKSKSKKSKLKLNLSNF
jgi:hypothetical protein